MAPPVGKDDLVRIFSWSIRQGKFQRMGRSYPRGEGLVHGVCSGSAGPLSGRVLPGKGGDRKQGRGVLRVTRLWEKSLRGMCGDGILRQLGCLGIERHTRDRSQTGEAGAGM